MLTVFEIPWNPATLTNAAIRAAWGHGNDTDAEPALPIAFYPMHVHPRLQVQQSCFTIHGRRKDGLEQLLASIGLDHFLRAIDIDPTRSRKILDQLQGLGVSQSSLFPDLNGLAADLTRQVWDVPW